MSKGRYYPKGPKQPGGQKGNPQEMMRQLQQIQRQMAQAQEALAGETVEYSAGGGMVKVVADGHQNVKSIAINPEVLDPDDVSMLEDLVLVAVNGALEESRRVASEKMGAFDDLAQGLGLPPGLDLGGL